MGMIEQTELSVRIAFANTRNQTPNYSVHPIHSGREYRVMGNQTKSVSEVRQKAGWQSLVGCS